MICTPLPPHLPPESLDSVVMADSQDLRYSVIQSLMSVELTAKGAKGRDSQAENGPAAKGTSEISPELSPSAPAGSLLVQLALGQGTLGAAVVHSRTSVDWRGICPPSSNKQ